MNTPSKRRYDPDRRDRIIDAALDVIAQYGVAGTTHRRVAQAADVPLGAMTYYFDGMEALLQEAFARLADTMTSQFSASMHAATTKEQARQVIIDWVCSAMWQSERNLVLVFEFTAFAAREVALRPQLQRWMGMSEGYLSQHFGASTAKVLDAFVDGVVMHNIMSDNHITREEVTEFVYKLTA
jgi:TetR/AcrR family transcriptional regulator, regulator of biofilm formation and stress response